MQSQYKGATSIGSQYKASKRLATAIFWRQKARQYDIWEVKSSRRDYITIRGGSLKYIDANSLRPPMQRGLQDGAIDVSAPEIFHFNCFELSESDEHVFKVQVL